MNFIPLYIFVLYCVFKKVFFKKNYWEAISEVHVNFNNLQITFNPQKIVFSHFMRNYVQFMEK